jgi:membrane protease YdiL (CAAX protease family)
VRLRQRRPAPRQGRFIENTIDGAILAVVYFATNRNLLAAIIAHGIPDTVDVLLIYFGVYPGLEFKIALF